MNTLFNCKIFAHRGANRQAPENTVAAFDRALNHAIDGIETDVQLSRDAIPVLYHDQFLDKLGLPGKPIDDFDFKQLQAMRFTQTPDYEGLISLEAFIRKYRGRCTLNLEVKHQEGESVSRQQQKMQLTLDIIGESQADDVFVSSFNLQSLEIAYQYSRKTPLFYILEAPHTDHDVDLALSRQLFLTGFCLPITGITSSLVEHLQALGKTVVTYTCNSEAEIQRALDLNVAMMITDDPQLALKLRSSRHAMRTG
ncbi:glycerophosphodiester phosphodiesterase [Methylicorpusculum oleiharenae]|uniref:glycerophosphodiester phosphodiesterase n=1 Tax=Methylicorpusculum oleiharenae TaxID=1338687 RepID=UPI00135AF05C|nr:glycerophosphodiester phosphodiesterase [Methylicorpusculum oleiharenae]MCD2451427.1 glycerophosphodiester phosphodiesterase [Methylicorpusculum oleiharenae]